MNRRDEDVMKGALQALTDAKLREVWSRVLRWE
jgi:hypothetical protein